MSIRIFLFDGPLPADPPPLNAIGAGAVLGFEGVVRPLENDRPIAGLEYAAYEPMTRSELRRLAEATLERFGLIGLTAEHSSSFVPAGQCSFRLRVAAYHRKEALAAVDWFIDQLKRDVPIWKAPVFSEPSPDRAVPKERP